MGYRGPALGLWNSPNVFSQTPAGTLKTADNVRFTAPGVIEPRRGLHDYTSGFGTTASRMDAFVFYASTILGAYDLTKVALYTPDDDTWTDKGAYEPSGTNRMRFEGAARSMFFNPIDGVRVWDGVGGNPSTQPRVAGCPQPLVVEAFNDSDNGWMPPNTAVAYRSTICSKDAFGRVVEGPPSGRTVLMNSIVSTFPTSGVTRSGGTTVHVTTDLPHELADGDTVTLVPGEANFAAGSFVVTVDTVVQFHYTQAGSNVSMTQTANWEITRSATLYCDLPVKDPLSIDLNNFVRLYRSLETLDAFDTPSDEMFLCNETPYLTATDITNGYIQIDDTTPEDVLDVPLYTNENTGAGALQANFRPPVAEDLVYWANRMWYANTTRVCSVEFQLLGTGAPDGLQDGDTITFHETISGSDFDFTYTAKTVPAAPGDFNLYSWADPGLNIEQTAQALCAVINNDSDNALYAQYISSEGGAPGGIRVEGATPFPFTFSVYSSRATCWTPQLPTLVSPAFAPLNSTNDRHAARVYYSRLAIPDAVPLVNYVDINSDNDPILRVFPLHYRLLIFKTDGIYTCTNVEPFVVQKLSAYRLLAPDSVCVLEDRVYCLTDQGWIVISDSGCEQVSNCIDDTYNAMMSQADIATLAERSFGLAYRSERQVLLWSPEKQDDGTVSTDNEQAFVYSTLSEGFTRYAFGARCAVINPDDNTFVYAPTDENILRQENKNLTDLDYYDDVLTVHVSSISGSAVTLTSAAGVEAGDVLQRSGGRYLITEVSGNVLTILGAPSLTAGTAFVFKAIATELEFNKLTDGTPADLKIIGQARFLFRENGIHTITAKFSSEVQGDPKTSELTAVGWGEFPWGDVPYGNPCEQIRRVEPIPEQVTECAQFSVGFTTLQALAKFEFLGVDVVEREDAQTSGR